MEDLGLVDLDDGDLKRTLVDNCAHLTHGFWLLQGFCDVKVRRQGRPTACEPSIWRLIRRTERSGECTS